MVNFTGGKGKKIVGTSRLSECRYPLMLTVIGIELITNEVSFAVNIYPLSALIKCFLTLAFFFNSADWFSATLLEEYYHCVYHLRYVGVLVTLSTD